VVWIHLAQDRYQWEVLVNTVTNIWVPLTAGNFVSTQGHQFRGPV